MKLEHIALSRLAVSPANMRAGAKPPDISDILPSVKARGVLVPLIVRKAAEDAFEIVAGRRRFFAAREALGGEDQSVPCAIMDEADDASALETSLIENVARSDPHEVEQWESFTRLVRQGRSAEEIAAVFGLSEREVAQVLALGNLLPKIRDLYRREEIDAASIRLLTMASKARQKEWLALLADPNEFAPVGSRLKSWLFGGASIPTSHALFDLASYKGEVVADLFGENSYFACTKHFWAAQREAVEVKRQAYLEQGWSEVVILEPGSWFHSWEYEKTPKRKGGKVFILLSPRGEVTVHEGYLSRAEARRKAKGEAIEAKPQRAELSSALANYIDLHRHAAVRAALVRRTDVALRLAAAHMVSGSSLFTLRPDPQRSHSDAIRESVETCVSETRLDATRRETLALLGLDNESLALLQGYGSHGREDGTAALFLRMLKLTDEEVMKVIAVAMAEALECSSLALEAAGFHLGVDMSKAWAADDTFIALLRDKEVLNALLGEVAGEAVAMANAKEKAAVQQGIVRDVLDGTNGREQLVGWVPRWMAFPPSAYTARGGVGPASRNAELERLLDAVGEAQAVEQLPAEDAAPAESDATLAQAA